MSLLKALCGYFTPPKVLVRAAPTPSVSSRTKKTYLYGLVLMKKSSLVHVVGHVNAFSEDEARGSAHARSQKENPGHSINSTLISLLDFPREQELNQAFDRLAVSMGLDPTTLTADELVNECELRLAIREAE